MPFFRFCSALALAAGLTLVACSQETAAPFNSDAVQKINEAIDSKTLMQEVSRYPYGSPESIRILGAYMKKAFAKAGYDSDKTFLAYLESGGDPVQKQRFARESGLYRILKSVDAGNADEIRAWVDSGAVSEASIKRYQERQGR